MDYTIEWSPEALDDIESIAEYISRDSEFYARTVVTGIIALARRLNEFPFLGRVVPERKDKNIRERFAYSYRVVYQIEQKRILIVASVC